MLLQFCHLVRLQIFIAVLFTYISNIFSMIFIFFLVLISQYFFQFALFLETKFKQIDNSNDHNSTSDNE